MGTAKSAVHRGVWWTLPRVAIVGAIAATLAGCSSDPSYRHGVAHVDSVAVTSVSPNAVSFLVYAGFPTPCWEYTGFMVDGVPTSPPGGEPVTVDVVLHGQIETQGGCIDIWAPFEQALDIDLPGAGTYAFRFETLLLHTVDTTLVVQ